MYLHNPITERLVKCVAPDEVADAAELIAFHTEDYRPPPAELTETELLATLEATQ